MELDFQQFIDEGSHAVAEACATAIALAYAVSAGARTSAENIDGVRQLVPEA
jgi:hypothetical protein